MNGLELNVHECGAGKTAVVLLHYFGGSGRTWENVTRRLSKTARCIAPDLRGFGASDAPGNYSVQDNADDLSALIAHLDSTRWTLVGHSMGAKFACALAARRPVGLRELILVAPSPPTPEPMSNADRASLRAGWGSEDAAREALHKITAQPLETEAITTVIADNLRASQSAWDGLARHGQPGRRFGGDERDRRPCLGACRRRRQEHHAGIGSTRDLAAGQERAHDGRSRLWAFGTPGSAGTVADVIKSVV